VGDASAGNDSVVALPLSVQAKGQWRPGMTESQIHGDPPKKLLAGGMVKVKIALASGLVLILGAWLLPDAPQTLSAPLERAAPLLDEQVQLREVVRPFAGVQEFAAPVRQHSVAIVGPASPAVASWSDYLEPASTARPVAGFGVFVSDIHVLTHGDALDGRSIADVSIGNGLTLSASVVAHERSTGLVLLLLQQAAERAPAPLAVEAPAPGALAVAVGRTDERELAVPVFITSAGPDGFTLGAVGDTLRPGMPVFNPAGELVALAVPNGREARAIPVGQAVERMLALASTDQRPSSFGLALQVPTGLLTDIFGHEGVLISNVLPGGPGDAADIRVGDVLLAVDDVEVDSAETAASALSAAIPGTPTPLRIRRGARVTDIQATPASAYEIAALARSSPHVLPGPEARVLFPDAVLAAAAIPPSARVVSVNGRPMTTRLQAQRELRLARTPLTVLLRQGSDQFFAAVEPRHE